MKHVYAVRHGESEMNVLGLLAGTTETPLTKNGRQQARQAGVAAKGLHIDYIISSPQSRAHETAKEIARTIGYPLDQIELSDLLVERDFGSQEGKPYTNGPSADDVPDAETRASLMERATLAWQHIQTIPADNILVVTHGSTGRMLRHITNPSIPFKVEGTAAKARHHFPNAKIVRLV